LEGPGYRPEGGTIENRETKALRGAHVRFWSEMTNVVVEGSTNSSDRNYNDKDDQDAARSSGPA
jgi:hypothetical protein